MLNLATRGCHMVNQKFRYASTLGQDHLGQRRRNFTFMGPHNNFFRKKNRYSKSRDTLTYVSYIFQISSLANALASNFHTKCPFFLLYAMIIILTNSLGSVYNLNHISHQILFLQMLCFLLIFFFSILFIICSNKSIDFRFLINV